MENFSANQLILLLMIYAGDDEFWNVVPNVDKELKVLTNKGLIQKDTETDDYMVTKRGDSFVCKIKKGDKPEKKRFIYFLSTEGGMDTMDFKFGANEKVDFDGIFGWMSKGCVSNDTKLNEWGQKAEIGDWFNHRMGVAVRVKYKNNKK